MFNYGYYQDKMIRFMKKLLVANRGEIACRILRTAKKLGIQTVAIHSDIDANSKFVSMADKAYRVGPNPSLESYLNSNKIIDICKQSGCEAIHPGFGFLSENAAFVELCENNGITFVGPPAKAMIQMGSKSASKLIMTEANVPVVPGYHLANQDPQLLLSESKNIGFPVLIKAVSGGGGKGMRIVHREEDFFESLESCKRESLKAFKDDNVLVEKYIVRPRHIEVQIFGDQQGNYVHLFERDCSIQRRHQKVVEEAPSNISNKIREGICESAINAAKAVGYYNAGTVEFIFDLDSNKHYFMEMNTRLQVEHPITEMITGEDLVEWQLRVASKMPLPKTQEQIHKKGHAIEVRVYSQNPYNGFLPGNGKLKYFREPQEDGKEVRIQTGVREDDEISTFYDPMIAKLITYAPTRHQAISSMNKALSQYRVVGLPTNLKFLKNVFTNPVFIQGDYDTSFIEKNIEDLVPRTREVDVFDVVSAIAVKAASSHKSLKIPAELIGFRNGSANRIDYKVRTTASFFEKEIETTVISEGGTSNSIIVSIDGKKLPVTFELTSPTTVLVSYGGLTTSREFHLEGEKVYLFDSAGDTLQLEIKSNEIREVTKEEDTGKTLKSPMPGTIVKVYVKAGDSVKKGAPLFVMEAMKMEHTMRAPADGKVKTVSGKDNQFIEAGFTVIELE